MNPNVEEFTLLALLTKELHAFNSALEKGKLRDGIKYILNVSRHGNQYMQVQKPWVLVKGSNEEKYDNLYYSVNATGKSYCLSILLKSTHFGQIITNPASFVRVEYYKNYILFLFACNIKIYNMSMLRKKTKIKNKIRSAKIINPEKMYLNAQMHLNLFFRVALPKYLCFDALVSFLRGTSLIFFFDAELELVP